MPPNKRKSVVTHFVCADGSELRVGDSALLRPETSSELPYVGKVIRLSSKAGPEPKDPADINVLFSWYYRPEEAVGGRKGFHGVRELFRSKHQDWVSASCVISACQVYTLEEYQRLEDLKPNDYYTRYAYDPVGKKFNPDRVPVFCKCQYPYNPDLDMLVCDVCQNWFHPACVGLHPDELQHVEHYVCPDCTTQSAKRRRLELESTASAATSQNGNTVRTACEAIQKGQ